MTAREQLADWAALLITGLGLALLAAFLIVGIVAFLIDLVRDLREEDSDA